jgi:hypothetical protein
MREAMPQVAGMVDELRQVLGAQLIDGLLLRAKRGAPVFYAAEIGADGVLREFGRAPSGQRVIALGGVVQWPANQPGVKR